MNRLVLIGNGFAIVALFSIIMWLLTRKWDREDEEWRKKYYNKKK